MHGCCMDMLIFWSINCITPNSKLLCSLYPHFLFKVSALKIWSCLWLLWRYGRTLLPPSLTDQLIIKIPILSSAHTYCHNRILCMYTEGMEWGRNSSIRMDCILIQYSHPICAVGFMYCCLLLHSDNATGSGLTRACLQGVWLHRTVAP